MNQMGPEVIVILGEFVSPETACEGFAKLKESLEFILQILIDYKLDYLREMTQWVLVPSLNEQGVCKIMPAFKMSDYLISGMKGHGKIQNITLATNPMRLSFRGKEIVFSRYDYFKRVKRAMIQRISERFFNEGLLILILQLAHFCLYL